MQAASRSVGHKTSIILIQPLTDLVIEPGGGMTADLQTTAPGPREVECLTCHHAATGDQSRYSETRSSGS